MFRGRAPQGEGCDSRLNANETGGTFVACSEGRTTANAIACAKESFDHKRPFPLCDGGWGHGFVHRDRSRRRRQRKREVRAHSVGRPSHAGSDSRTLRVDPPAPAAMAIRAAGPSRPTAGGPVGNDSPPAAQRGVGSRTADLPDVPLRAVTGCVSREWFPCSQRSSQSRSHLATASRRQRFGSMPG